MAIVEVKVPQLSESVAEATLLTWKKKPGEAVAMDEILIEVETDKVVLEVPAPSAGVLVELVAEDGATVHYQLVGAEEFDVSAGKISVASPVGKDDALRIVTQGRKERYGLIAISQHVEHFAGISTQDLPNRIVTPFKPSERQYAVEAYRKIGIDPDEYPEVLDLRTVEGHGYAYFLDEFGRAGLVDLLPPVQHELVSAFDTRNLGAGPPSPPAGLPC